MTMTTTIDRTRGSRARALLLLGLTAGFGLLETTPALAANGKSYPATFCQTYWGHGAEEFSYSSIGNTGTSLMAMDCPLVQDEGGGLHFTQVALLDRHSTQSACCTPVWAKFFGGTLRSFIGRAACTEAAGSSSFWQSLRTDGLPGEPASSYYLSCLLPPKTADGLVSRIGQYFAEEP